MLFRRILASAALIGLTSVPCALGAAQGAPVQAGLAPFVAVNAPSVAIVHVRVIDGTGHEAQNDRTVVFSAGTIVASGAAATTAVPADATTIDGTGKTLLPGYVGTHNHLFTGVGPAGHHYWRSMPFSFPRLYLAAGTTTIRTTGSMDIYADLHLRASIDAGTALGPNIDVTSPYLTGPGNEDPEMYEVRDAADGRATVDYWADRGVTSFKVYTNIGRDALGAVIAEAHVRGLKVMGHLCSIGYHEAAALGIDELEHGPYFTDSEFVPSKKADTCPSRDDLHRANANLAPSDRRIAELIADLVRRHVGISSTLAVYESLGRVPSVEAMGPTLALLDPEQRAYVEATRLRGAARRDDDLRVMFANEMAFERQFARAGGLLTCGPDPSGYGAVIAGLGDWRDLELLVEAGLTPIEAIHVATENGAIALGRAATVGTIAVGKHADLILVAGDPSKDIADVEKVETVFMNGTGYDSKKLIDSVRGLVGRI